MDIPTPLIVASFVIGVFFVYLGFQSGLIKQIVLLLAKLIIFAGIVILICGLFAIDHWVWAGILLFVLIVDRLSPWGFKLKTPKGAATFAMKLIVIAVNVTLSISLLRSNNWIYGLILLVATVVDIKTIGPVTTEWH